MRTAGIYNEINSDKYEERKNTKKQHVENKSQRKGRQRSEFKI